MNEIASKQRLPRTTQAAEGLPRWRWTTVELERLAELGAFADEDRFELIGGEIVPMSPKGRLHELVADELQQYWSRRIPLEFSLGTERQFNLAADTYVTPDILVRPASIKVYELSGPDALLVVEIADTSIAYDQNTKAQTYSRFGVREYWVINARTLETVVHLEPSETGYGNVTIKPSGEHLTPTLVPALGVRLADLDLG